MPEPAPVKIEFTLTPEDVQAHMAHYERHHRDLSTSSNLSYLYVPSALGFAVMVVAAVAGLGTGLFAAALAIALGSYLLGVLVYRYEVEANYRHMMRRSFFDDPDAQMTRMVSLEGDRLVYSSARTQWSLSYTQFDRVGIAGRYVCVAGQRIGPLLIPLSAFASPEEAQAFCADLTARLAAARAADAKPS